MNFPSFGLILSGLLILSATVQADGPAAKNAPVPFYWNANSWEKGSAQKFWKETALQNIPSGEKRSENPRPSSPEGKEGNLPSTPQVLDRQTEK